MQLVGNLGLDSAHADATSEDRCVRDLHELLSRVPDLMLLEGVLMPGERRIESLIAVGAAGTATLEMLETTTGCMISRGSDGLYFASVVLPHRDRECSAAGATMALAIIAALAIALQDQPELRPGPTLAPTSPKLSESLH
jgi:hypothetical protein